MALVNNEYQIMAKYGESEKKMKSKRNEVMAKLIMKIK